MNRWAEALATPSRLCPWGLGGGRRLARGRPLLKACLPDSQQGLFHPEFPGGRGLEGGGAESVGWGSQAGFSPSSLRASPVPPKSPRQKPSDLCEGETRNTGDDRVQGVSSVALNK